MGSRRPKHTRPPGRPLRLLEPAVRETLIDALKMGTPVAIACQAASISESSFYGWMQRGYSEQEERANPEGEPDDDETPYLELFHDVQKARAAAAVRNIGVVQKVAQGGTVTETTKETLPDGTVRETVKRQPPDWRAAAWYLERSHRQEYAKGPEQVELTGANGGPVQITADAEDLSRRLAEHLAAGITTAAAGPLALPSYDESPIEPVTD